MGESNIESKFGTVFEATRHHKKVMTNTVDGLAYRFTLGGRDCTKYPKDPCFTIVGAGGKCDINIGNRCKANYKCMRGTCKTLVGDGEECTKESNQECKFGLQCNAHFRCQKPIDRGEVGDDLDVQRRSVDDLDDHLDYLWYAVAWQFSNFAYNMKKVPNTMMPLNEQFKY